MIATTIMISTRVKPARSPEDLGFMDMDITTRIVPIGMPHVPGKLPQTDAVRMGYTDFVPP